MRDRLGRYMDRRGLGCRLLDALICSALVLAIVAVVSLVASCKLPPIVVVPIVTRTPTVAPGKTPTPVPFATPSTIRFEPGPLVPLTDGKAVIEVDVRDFKVVPPLDTYAFATFCWTDPKAPVSRKGRPQTPCVQLALRGLKWDAMRVEVRQSSNLAYDGTPGLAEKDMCGEGTRMGRWLKVPQGAEVFRLGLAWEPEMGLVVSSDVASVKLRQGIVPGHPWGSFAIAGYGWWVEGIPKRGIGYSYEDRWTLQAYGGSVRLLSWESTGVQLGLGECPGS